MPCIAPRSCHIVSRVAPLINTCAHKLNLVRSRAVLLAIAASDNQFRELETLEGSLTPGCSRGLAKGKPGSCASVALNGVHLQEPHH